MSFVFKLVGNLSETHWTLIVTWVLGKESSTNHVITLGEKVVPIMLSHWEKKVVPIMLSHWEKKVVPIMLSHWEKKVVSSHVITLGKERRNGKLSFL